MRPIRIELEHNETTPEQLELHFTTTPGKLYTVEASQDLNIWSILDGFPSIASSTSNTIPIQISDASAYFFKVTERDEPLPLLNHQSGISVGLSGTNGVDWLVEHNYHDQSNTDQVIYLRSDVSISLFHNENNSLMNRNVGLPTVLGSTGLDGIPNNGDEGDIHWKVDRDMQSHTYNKIGSIPSWAPLYSSPIQFDSLTYDGSLAVLGTTGDNGEPWGEKPRTTTDCFAYGQIDAFGNEWHTLTYWDDDEPVYTAGGKNSHRQGASDGHWVYICVDPVTPILQFISTQPEDQFYTTPIKTYHVPKTWEQTTYLTDGVEIQFSNLTTNDPVEYRINDGPWQIYGSRIAASDIVAVNNTAVTLEFRNGSDGPSAQRTLVLNPEAPAPEEVHGFLLWADAGERTTVINKLSNIQPFKRSYQIFKTELYQNLTSDFTDVRGGWRSGTGSARLTLRNAFWSTISGPNNAADAAAIAKRRLLRLARQEPVGFEREANATTPAKDYLNELGQTLQLFGDAAVAYDLLAANYRDSDDANGMTPIEEFRIRDGLAEVAKSMLQMRANCEFAVGAGDVHWAHGYELAIGLIASAMPSYKTPYFGVSGGDFETVNDLVDNNGKYWNPFPDQGITWWAAVTDPFVDTPGHPNVMGAMRSETVFTDNGYWVGPNAFSADGDRYFDGPGGRKLVGIDANGFANAEGTIELVEMSGYEAPFDARLQALDFIRRIRGDDTQQKSVNNYIRRRLMQGFVTFGWDSVNQIYYRKDARAVGAIFAYNNYNEAASLPSTTAIMGKFLSDINRSYGYEPGTSPSYISTDRKVFFEETYALALCWAPDTITAHVSEPNHAPIIKPTFKQVVHPGDLIFKELVIMDPDDDSLTISVTNLPSGATYDSATRTIEWIPTGGDAGVHIATITASDPSVTTTTHFPMIVKPDAPSGPIPSEPLSATAILSGNDITVSWSAPSGVSISHYIVWRDSIPAVILSPGTTSWVDYDLPAGSHTRYHVSLLTTTGAESGASVAAPGYILVE